jgi:predicted pyridoxine 5'-phosphate oxidase superfamily flavin-nucleotide-binding protein
VSKRFKVSLAYVIAWNLRGRAVIRDYMAEQHRAFFAALPFMVVGMADQNGHPWPTTLSGHPGFVNSTEPNLLTIKAWLDPGDPSYSCLRDGAPIGGLGIELSTRRRNRINGRIENCVVGEGFSIRVQQSFGNRPTFRHATSGHGIVPSARPNAERLPISAIAKSVLLPKQTRFLLRPGRRNSTRKNPRKVSMSPTVADVLASCG